MALVGKGPHKAAKVTKRDDDYEEEYENNTGELELLKLNPNQILHSIHKQHATERFMEVSFQLLVASHKLEDISRIDDFLRQIVKLDGVARLQVTGVNEIYLPQDLAARNKSLGLAEPDSDGSYTKVQSAC